jgi:hypothetical protein
MKTLIIIGLLTFCFASSFWGCQKEDLGNLDSIFADTTNAGPVPQMTAKINGVSWAATSYDLSLQPGTSGQIVITGQSDDGQAIELYVKKGIAGDYLLSKLSQHIASYIPDSITSSYYNSNSGLSTGGVINIASIDSSKLIMSGEFNFIGGRSDGTTRTITEGRFSNLGYTNIAVLNPKFSARKNYGIWNPVTVTTQIVSGTTPMINITAVNDDGSKMNLFMPENIAVTVKYPYRLTSVDGNSPYNINTKTACVLYIKSHDMQNRKIQGSFSFYAVPANATTQKGVHISSGVFNVTY